jgi:hypothetical protein
MKVDKRGVVVVTGSEVKGPCANFEVPYPGVELRENLKSNSHRCYPILLAFIWELTNQAIETPLGYLQGGLPVLNIQSHRRRVYTTGVPRS